MGDYLNTEITTNLGPRNNGMLGMSLADSTRQIGNILPKPPDVSNYPKLLPKETMDKVNNHVNNSIAALGARLGTDYLSNLLSNKIFDDSELGRGLGTLFSSGLSSAGNTITNNIIKGRFLAEGLGQNTGASLAGAGTGLAANYLGKGITSLMGDSRLGRAVGQGISTGLGTIGGTAASNLINTGSFGKLFGKGAGAINPYGLAMTVVGSALGAATGPSKEYSGKYGNITQLADTAYDLVSAGVNFIPGVGQLISGGMVLNKGLSNIFGSTDGMTKTDAILGSAFMGAPIKWLNMAGASKTGNFNNQSWQNSERANSFMGDAFGNLNDRFDRARTEAGKTYGTFSQGAKRRAQENIDFANYAWNRILAMSDQNELLNIRSQAMSSINNLRYALMIQGGWSPVAIGKQGMKIFNNATNHNIGMRLLSGAALIDNKQMILSAQGGTKVVRSRNKPHRKGEQPVYTEEEKQLLAEWNAHLEEVRKQRAEEQARKLKLREEAAAKFNLQANTVMEAMTLQSNETPFTGLEYQQAAKDLRQKKVEKFHEAEKVIEATMMADLAAPLLLRGFRWAFNKAGLLVKAPRTTLKGFNYNDLPKEKYTYNDKTGDWNIDAPKKEWVKIGENDLVPDYFQSRAEYDRLIASGASPEEAAEIMETRYLNVMDARPGIFRNLGKRPYGESRVENGIILPVYNNRKHVLGSLNDAKTTLNTVFHELGGHGSSMNVQYGVPLKGVSDDFALRLFKILEHNEKLRPKLRPFFLAIKDGDLLKAKELIPKDGSYLKGMNGEIDIKRILDWIKYMEENLEYSARAIGSNMSNHYGMLNGFNELQLREVFTDESVDNLLKNVWNYGVPITVGGSTAATLYNNK